MRVLVALCVLLGVASADPDPHRKVIVLEYRAGSSALQGIAARIVSTLGKQTSLNVMGPDQTRAVYGEHLDQVIVKCAGEADCVARIGQKVGAAEVILVGISELGDVILTMQRIQVSDRSVQGRVADSLASGAPPSEAQLDTYLGKILPPSDFLRFGVIAIEATEQGAHVTINKEPKGETPIPALKLPAPAQYDIHVEKNGFVPFDTSINLPADGEIKLPVRLQRPGGGKGAWYTRWYVVAAASVIVVGAAGGVVYYESLTTPDTASVGGGIHGPGH